MLKNGSSGDEVMALQKSLLAMGYNPGKADGVYGPNTMEAVKKLQEKAGLSADGIFGPDTEAALAKLKGSMGAPDAIDAATDAATEAASDLPDMV